MRRPAHDLIAEEPHRHLSIFIQNRCSMHLDILSKVSNSGGPNAKRNFSILDP